MTSMTDSFNQRWSYVNFSCVHVWLTAAAAAAGGWWIRFFKSHIFCSRQGTIFLLMLSEGSLRSHIFKWKLAYMDMYYCNSSHCNLIFPSIRRLEVYEILKVSRLKDLGVLGVRGPSLLSVVDGPSLLWSSLSPCSSDFPGCLADGSRPDMNSMLCFRLSSLSYRNKRSRRWEKSK